MLIGKKELADVARRNVSPGHQVRPERNSPLNHRDRKFAKNTASERKPISWNPISILKFPTGTHDLKDAKRAQRNVVAERATTAPGDSSRHVEGHMPRSYDSLTLEDAKRMLSAGEAKAASLGIAYNIAIVDAGGHLVAFVRQDGALIGSIDLAINKAVTARIFDKATSALASLAQPAKPLFGIQESNAGKVVIFGGGIPVMFDGSIVGAVGASAGTVEQDIAVAEAAISALGRPAQPSRRSRSNQEGTERTAQ